MTITTIPTSTGPQNVPKPWGTETNFANGESGYDGEVITVKSGQCLSLQFHHEKTGTQPFITGFGIVEVGESRAHMVSVAVQARSTVRLPAGMIYRVAATADLTFVEEPTAAPGWRDAVVRRSDAYGREETSAP